MKKLLKVLLALVLGFSLTGCKPEEPADFTYAVGGEPEYFDPAVGSDSATSYFTNQMYYPLVRIDEEGLVVKEAAKDIVVTTNDAGNQIYTITLIDGLKWSNGDDCTAEHYVYGMKRSLGMGPDDAYYSYFIADYVLNAKAHSNNKSDVAAMTDLGIKALDAKTIEITLTAPCDYFTQLLAAGVFYPAHPDYAKEHDSTWADNAKVPTNGAFYTQKIDRSTKVRFVKNEYFVHADKVSLNIMDAVVMPDMDAQLVNFKTGDIDWATSVNSTVATEYNGKPELLVSESIINYFMHINSKTSLDALKDVNVRRALSLGINRASIVTALNVPAVYFELKGFVPAGFPDANGEGDFRTVGGDLVKTDKEEAKRLLAAAGYTESNPLKLKYAYNASAMHTTVAEVLKQELASINVELTLEPAELRTFFANRDDGLFELSRHAMSADYMDTTTYLDMAASWTQKATVWGDETYDSLLQAAAKLTGAERIKKLHEAEKYLVQDQVYTIPLFQYNQVSLVKDGLTGYMTSPQANFTFWYVQMPAAAE